jgi:hypothetical protein
MYKIIQLHATDPEEVLRHAFAVMSDQEWERTVGAARLLDGYQLISLGTDDYIEIHDYSDWLARMDVKDITTEDAIALDRILGTPSATSMHEKLSGNIRLLYGVGSELVTQYGQD